MARKTDQHPRLKTTKGGDWTFTYRRRVNEGGVIEWRQARHTFSAQEYKGKKVAQKYLDDFMRQFNSPDFRPLKEDTFEQFAQMWIREIVLPKQKRSSQKNICSKINARLIPFFGHMKMKDIGLLEVQQFVGASSDLQPNTLKDHVSLLNLMCRKARKYGFTATTWEKEDVDFPRFVPNEQPFFTEAQMKEIVNRGGEYQLLYWVLAETGIRIGEALGLKREDVNALTAPATITIRRSMFDGQEQTPKTRSGFRRFCITDALCQEFLRGPRVGYLFHNNGLPLTLHFPYVKLKAILKDMGIEGAFHSFRRGAATQMEDEAVPMSTKMQRLGHATAAMTQRYTKALDQNDIAYVRSIEGKYRPERVQ